LRRRSRVAGTASISPGGLTLTHRVPDDALELLSPESLVFWQSGGAVFGEDFPPELDGFSSTVVEWRASGMNELEIACAFARMLRLAREEHAGVIERVTLEDGSAVIFEHDPRRRFPLIGRRRFRLTVARLALGLCAIAIVAVLVFVFTNVLNAWMPNVATSALTIAVTITVVDRLIRREEQQRLQPRIRGSLSQLSRLVDDFARTDYIETHERTELGPGDDPLALFDRWLADDEDLPRRLPEGSVPYVLADALELARQAKVIADADREILPPDLVAAIDELERKIRGVERVHQLLHRSDVEQSEGSLTALRLAVAEVSTFVSVYDRPNLAWTRSLARDGGTGS
jgi:hypothetical protein